jgi:hypothetical protein
VTGRGRLFLGLAVAVALLAGWWLHSRFRWVREETWAGYQGEARDNPYLAAQRLLQRTGHPAACLRAFPDPLPPPGDLLVLPGLHQPLDPPAAAKVTAWVERGGLLLAAAPLGEGPVPDPLFHGFGVGLEPLPPHPAQFTVTLGGVGLRLAMGGRARLRAGKDLAQAGPGSDTALAYRVQGAGAAVLCADLDCLRNDQIQRLDHADFLCGVAAVRPGRKVWIVLRSQAPSLGAWLGRNTWPFLAALGVLVLSGLWAAAPRFGPPLADPDPARRSFLEHLDACGRYQWRVARGRSLLGASRDAFSRRLARVHPAWAALDPEAQCQRLARHSGLPEGRIARALHLPGPSHSAGFLEAIQTLRHLGKSL